MKAWSGPVQIQEDQADQRPGGVGKGVLMEEDRADEGRVTQSHDIDRGELVVGRLPAQVGDVADVRREAGRPGKDGQRESRHDLAGAEGDGKKRVDQRRCRRYQGGHRDPAQQAEPTRPTKGLHCPEAADGAHQHHAFDAQVEHP